MRGRRTVLEGANLAIGAANSHVENPDRNVGGTASRGLGVIDNVNAVCFGGNGDGFHAGQMPVGSARYAPAVRGSLNHRSFALLALNFLAFVSLGLPDGLLGVAWPSLRASFALPLDALAPLLASFTTGYVVSSFGAGAVLGYWNVGGLLAASCLLTGLSLAGYAAAPFWMGVIGAGAIDVGVNAYVATHHGPRMLNWMHAAYGIGAASGPLVMTSVLMSGRSWRCGYAIVAAGQVVLAGAFAANRAKWPPLVQ